MSLQPTDMAGLRRLYFDEFVPLYDYISAKLESVPSELHFEISAAFDHVMRAGLEFDGRAPEAENIAKAGGHLKRATFDAFKLLYKYTTRRLWKKLTRSRYECVPGFVEKVNGLWYEANGVVERARGLERISHGDDPAQWSAAFDEWKKLRDITDELERLDVSDDAKRARRIYVRSWILASIGVVAAGVVSHYISVALDLFDKATWLSQ